MGLGSNQPLLCFHDLIHRPITEQQRVHTDLDMNYCIYHPFICQFKKGERAESQLTNITHYTECDHSGACYF